MDTLEWNGEKNGSRMQQNGREGIMWEERKMTGEERGIMPKGV